VAFFLCVREIAPTELLTVLPNPCHDIVSVRRLANAGMGAILVTFFWLAVTLPSICSGADTIALIDIGKPWAYLHDTNAPFPANEEWRLREFDDSTWPRALSGFSSVRNDEATWMTPSSTFASALFRKSFQVDDTNAVKSLILRIGYDAGFIAFLNGQEVARRGLPEGPAQL